MNDEKHLIVKLQAGDDHAFNDLVRRYQKPVYQIARRILNSHEEAEDTAQEVFIRAFQQIRSFRGDASLFTWIYRIAVNLSLNERRKKKLRRLFSLESVGFSITSSQPTPDQRIEKDDIIRDLNRAIERLPEKQRIVFELRYHQQLSHAEIARILNRDEGTIRANYFQAIQKLKKAVNR